MTRFILSRVICLLLLSLSAGGLRETQAREAPRFLFHWSSSASLDWMFKNNSSSGRMPMQTFRGSEILVKSFFFFRSGMSATFAWHHPTAAMAAGPTEIYAKSRGQIPARLLIIQPKRGARVLELDSYVGKTNPLPIQSIEEVDLVFHTHRRSGGKIDFQEWVVLNPEAIENFTADPLVIRNILMEELSRMRDPLGMEIDDADRLFPRKVHKMPQELELYLQSSTGDLAPALLRPFDQASLESYYGELKARMRPSCLSILRILRDRGRELQLVAQLKRFFGLESE